jgi:WD40 repeat protein
MPELRIVCQVIAEESEFLFKWSEGASEFDSYKLSGQPLLTFRRSATAARLSLKKLVNLYHERRLDEERDCLYELAQQGFALYRGIFRPEGSRAVEDWLKDAHQRNDIDSLEIIVVGAVNVPWNVVYGVDPTQRPFTISGPDDGRRHFWGIAHSLACGLRKDPLRNRPLMADPHVVFALHGSALQDLEQPAREKLLEFARKRTITVAQTRSELEQSLRQRQADIIYWFSHATPEYLYLGDDRLTAHDLFEMLDSPEKPRRGGIAFLNACQTAEVVAGDQAYLSALSDCGMSGIVGTEQETIDCYANEFGLEFLETFLKGNVHIAQLMRDLRPKHPLGLLYATYCPPRLRVSPAVAPSDPASITALAQAAAPKQPAPLAALEEELAPLGHLLGGAALTGEQILPLPEAPYMALAAYGRSERPLFAGRRTDCDRFTSILNAPSTRILILQGASGSGKTSFLRAEVVPQLEEECVGYQFLRRREEGGESDSSIIFVRAGKDLVAELSQAVWSFIAVPYPLRRPDGREKVIALLAIVSQVAGRIESPADLTARLRADSGLLHKILHALSTALPFAVLLIIDQAEEIFTQSQAPEALATLSKIAASREGDYKLIVSLRTEYYGRLINALRKGLHRFDTIREYLLLDFGEDDLVEAIERPAVDHAIPHTHEIPARKYGFSFQPGLPRKIAQEVRQYAANSQDSVLPLVQVICTQLFDRVVQRSRKPPVISAADLEAIGGVSGGMSRHVEGLIQSLFPKPADQAALKHLLANLYVQQPDGTLTTAIVPESDLAKDWHGATSFDNMLAIAAKPAYRLLKIGQLRSGDSSPTAYVSLGHDSLAKVAQRWKQKERERKRKQWEAAGAIAALSVIAFFVFLLQQTRNANRAVEQQRRFSNAERLAGKAQLVYNGRPDLAILLAAEGNRSYDNQETRSALITVLERDPRMVALLPGHTDGACHTAFSSDGQMLVAADCGGTVHFWDRATNTEKYRQLQIELESVIGLALTGSGAQLAVAYGDGPLQLWDIRKSSRAGECRFAPPPPDSRSAEHHIAFTPDGSRMAFSQAAAEVHLWKLPACVEEKTPVKFQKAVHEMQFSPNGLLLAAASNRGGVTVMDLQSNSILASIPDSTDRDSSGDEIVQALAFSPDSRMLAVAYYSGEVKVLQLVPPKAPERVPVRINIATAIGFGAHDDLLAVATTWNGVIQVWNRSTRQALAPLVAHSQGISSMKASPDGEVLASASSDEFVANWNLTARCRICSAIPAGKVDAAAFASNGGPVLFSVQDTIQTWDGSRSSAIRQGLPAAQIISFGDGKTAAVQSGDELHFLDARTGNSTAATISLGEENAFESIPAVSRSGGRVAWGFKTDDRRVWKVAVWNSTGRVVIPKDFGQILAIRFTPDERILVVADAKEVTFWKIPGLTPAYAAFAGHIKSNVWKAAALSEDASLLAEGENNQIRLWDLAAGEQLGHTLLGHNSAGFDFAFSRDGRMLASNSRGQGTIQLWDVDSQQPFGVQLHVPGEVVHLEFDPRGKRLLTVERNGPARIWELDSAKLREIAARAVNRNLSRKEWQDYVGSQPYQRTFANLPEPE